MVKKKTRKGNTVSKTQRTVKLSAKAYQALSDQSEKEGKPKEVLASDIICVALTVDQGAVSHGEQYDPAGKRIFRQAPV